MEEKKYYCLKCNRHHHEKLGTIYEKHLKFSNKKILNKNELEQVKSKIPDDKILEFDMKKLRPIAKRQINRLLKKLSYEKKPELYIWEINRLLLHEFER